MLSWFIDQIPWWVYLVVGLFGTGALFYFFSPILVPLWNLTPQWVKVAGGVILAIGLAFVGGRNRGAKDAKERQAQANAEAETNRVEKHDEIQKLPPADLDKRLDKWMRD